MTAPRRRWSFSLRTLFVVVTLCACWYSWELHVVRKRTAIRASAEKQTFYFQVEWPASAKAKPSHIGAIPWYRRLMGDEGYSVIWMPGGHGQTLVKEREEIHAAFPEAIMEQEATTAY
jgi:hypothetical protein